VVERHDDPRELRHSDDDDDDDATSVECSSERGQWHEEVQPRLTQLLHADLHRLGVPERVKYKLCMMMRRYQDATASQYLTAHWAPVSETALRQHLRLAASH